MFMDAQKAEAADASVRYQQERRRTLTDEQKSEAVQPVAESQVSEPTPPNEGGPVVLFIPRRAPRGWPILPERRDDPANGQP